MRLHVILTPCVGLALAYAHPAAAADLTVPYTAGDLAAGKIRIPDALKGQLGLRDGIQRAYELGGCKLVLTGSEIQAGSAKADCTALWLAKDLKAMSLSSAGFSAALKDNLVLTPLTPKSLPSDAFELVKAPKGFECKLCSAAAPPNEGYKVWLYVNEHRGWAEFTATDKGFDLPGEPIKRAEANGGSAQITGFANFDDKGQSGYSSFTIPVGDKRAGDEKGGDEVGDSACPEVNDLKDFCSTPPGDPKLYQVCFDLVSQGSGAGFPTIYPSGNQQIILPNRRVHVKVRHFANEKVEMSMQGDRGLFQPGFQISVPGEAHAEGGRKLNRTGCSARVSETTFGPRRPGQPADIVVKATSPGREERSQKLELLVEETYFGAVRLGAAVVFNEAVERVYEPRTSPGSGQQEVAVKDGGAMNTELVLGFAPYIVDYLATGEGRPAVTGGYGVSPYFGLGLLNASGTGLELLKSIHAGVEYEFVPSFSVALTFVARRVTRLAPGVEVGSPVTGMVPTTTGFGLGAGLVLNFSPAFLQIAARGSSTFFK